VVTIPTVTLDAMALNAVADEVQRARSKHGPMSGRHEAYAVILEELDEFWDECKKKSPDPYRLEEELIQVAAMACRALADLGLIEGAK